MEACPDTQHRLLAWDFWGTWEPPTFQSPVLGQLMERTEVPSAWVWARHSWVCAPGLSLSDSALTPGAVLGIRHRTATALPPTAPETLVETRAGSHWGLPLVLCGCERGRSQ